MIRVGTSHYQTTAHARAAGYDAQDIRKGRVSVGRPVVPEGCTLSVDASGRYFVSYPEQPKS